ncbi:MAG: single-stranded DNA-binding protein [Trueperaceae bacterium]|nr:single-stranded DNA-binding protein [Trueperaceae bacterium]
MALGLNHALLIGTLVREPDLRYTPAGLAVLRLDLGGDDHLHDEDGTLRARPWYQRATVFGAQAERVVDHVRTGTPIWLEGHVEQRSWETEEGAVRSALDVVGRRVEVLGLGARDPDDAFAVDARDQPRLRDAVNRVRMIGNLVRDVELRRSEAGVALARFTVAVRERDSGRGERGRGETARRDATRGDEDTKPNFVEVRAWRDTAIAADGLEKGTPVYLDGRLVTDAWTDGEGSRRWATRVEALRIETIERLSRSSEVATLPRSDPTTAEETGAALEAAPSGAQAGPPF